MYEPPPPQTKPLEERIQSWVRLLLWPATAFLLAHVGLQWIAASATSSLPTASTRAPAAAPSPMASPFVVTFPDTLTIVTPVPPPTVEPTATYAMSTKTPPLICGPWLKTGEVCAMGEAADPTPTPLSDCPAPENKSCIWTGRAADASPVVEATTTYVPSYTGPG